jgi:hypothetical protein
VSFCGDVHGSHIQDAFLARVVDALIGEGQCTQNDQQNPNPNHRFHVYVTLIPDADIGEAVKHSKHIQKPQHYDDDHDRIQDGLDRSLHGYESVDQPKQNTHDDQNHQYLK